MTICPKSTTLRLLSAALLLIATVQETPAQRVFSFTQYAKVTPAPNWSIFAGAFTSNMRSDLAAYHPSDGSVWVGRNTGTAFTFVQYATVSPPDGWRFVAGEFTGDNLTDLAAYHPSDGSVWVGRNTGSNFKFVQYATISPGPEWSFVAGDFTGDGLADIGAYYPLDGSVWVGANSGSNFKFVQYATISPGPEWSFVAGDFTGDGLADFGAYYPLDGSVWVGANRGSNFKFVQYATISPGTKWTFASGEFTGDERLDFAAIYSGDGSVWIGRNRGSDLQFTQHATVPPAVGWGLVSGDFAGDKLGDLGLYHPTDGSIRVGRNQLDLITLTSPTAGYSTTAKACPVAPCTALVDFRVQVSGSKPESVSLTLKRAAGAESISWLCTPPDPIEQIPGCATPPFDLSRSVYLTPDTWTVVANVKRNGVEEVTPPVTFTVHPPGTTSVGPVTLSLLSPNEGSPGTLLKKAPAGTSGGGVAIRGSIVDIIGKNLDNNDFIRDHIYLSPIPNDETTLAPQSALPLGNWCLYKAEFVSRQALGDGESKLRVRLPELPLQTPSECGVPQSPSGSIFTTNWRWVIRDPWIRPERVHSSWAIPSPRRDSAFGLPPFKLIKPPYPDIYGFGFPNQHTPGTYNEFLTVFGNSAYHCVDCAPVVGCACIAPRIPDPVYHLLWWPVYKLLIDSAFEGSCAGMASTSLLMARGELNPQSFDPDVLFPAGFTAPGDPAVYKKSNFCTPFCSPPKPANLWATIRMNHGAQLSREFLAEIIDTLGEAVLDPNNVTSIKGVPNATLERVRENPSGYVVCFFSFSGGHCITPYRVDGNRIYIYDNNAPLDEGRYIEISGGDYDYPARRTTDQKEPNRSNGIWAFPISLWKNARHVTGVQGLRTATGLQFVLMALGGDADMIVTNPTGGRWGREDDGKISDSLRGAVVVPVFGLQNGTPSNMPLLLAMNQPAPTIRITPKSGRYLFQTAEGGHTLQLEARAVSAGGRQLVRLGYTGGQLSSMDLTAQNTASRVVPRVGMNIAEGESVVFHWLGLDLPAGRSVAFTADRSTQSVSYRNTTGSPTRHMLLADYSAKKHGRMSYGPFEVPAGAAHRVAFAAWPAPDMLISEVDLNGDGRPDRTETIVGSPVSSTENPDASADLSIETAALPPGAEVGHQAAYTVTVKNHGPAPATNVSVMIGIAARESVSISAANGSCTMASNGLKCQVSDLPVGGKTAINFLVRTTAPESLTANVTAFASQSDDDWTNNSVTISIPMR